MQQATFSAKKAEKRSSDRLDHLEKLVNVVYEKFQPEVFLDWGCGNAQVTKSIKDVYNPKRTIGIDIFSASGYSGPKDIEYIQYLETPKKVKKPLINQFELLNEEEEEPLPKEEKLAIESESVDLITAFMSIHHFSNHDKTLKEIIRMLKPNGLLFFREHDVLKNDKKTIDYLNEVHRRWPHETSSNEEINYLSREHLKNMLTKLGMKYVASSDYDPKIVNKQKIYHSIFIKI